MQINNATAAFWERARNGNFPTTAIYSGTDRGENLYPCRVWNNGDLVPGKLVSSAGGCFISYDGKEILFNEYEVAVSSGDGFRSGFYKYGQSASNPMVDGGFIGSRNKILYVCGAMVNSSDWTVGKLEDGKCLAPYGGGEKSFSVNFQVLYHTRGIFELMPV